MGIPSYFSHIIQNYPGIQVANPVRQGQVLHHFFMDCNSIIYDVYYKIINSEDPTLASISYAEMESRLIAGIIEKIIHYIRLVAPKSSVYIAFDGVAPFAKMEQQRTRRYRSWYSESLMTDSLSASAKKPYPIYTGMFTPGTPFMKKLSKDIGAFFSNSTNTVAFENIQVRVSASDEVGEGEHKLFVFLRDYSAKNSEKCKAETVALYGLDADLIMLSIFHQKFCAGIQVFRESPEFNTVLLDKNNELLYILIC